MFALLYQVPSLKKNTQAGISGASNDTDDDEGHDESQRESVMEDFAAPNDSSQSFEFGDEGASFSPVTPTKPHERDSVMSGSDSPTPSPLSRPRKRAGTLLVPKSKALKKFCDKSVSLIRKALEKDKPRQGLLKYFSKATAEERQLYLDRTADEGKGRSEELALLALREELQKKTRERRWATERKRLQRAKMKNQEVLLGLRSPRGTKRRVSDKVFPH